MNRLLLMGLLTLSVMLTGCLGTFAEGIGKIAGPDLEAALVMANAQNDVAAINCYSTLLVVLKEQGGQTAPVIKGAFSAFQAVRGKIQGAGQLDAVADKINIGCAALFVNANFTMAKLWFMAP